MQVVILPAFRKCLLAYEVISSFPRENRSEKDLWQEDLTIKVTQAGLGLSGIVVLN